MAVTITLFIEDFLMPAIRFSNGALLANIGKLYTAQNSSVSAIQQLQKSVEVREAIRAGLRELPQADQQTYTDGIADDKAKQMLP